MSSMKQYLLFLVFGSLLLSGCLARKYRLDHDDDDDDDNDNVPRLDEDLVWANKHAFRFFVGPDSKFKTIQSAIDAVPLENNHRYVIFVEPGVYREKITVPATKDYITLIGRPDDKFGTIIVFNGNAANSGRTFNSSTFAVEADYFVAQYITFKNDAPFANNGAVGAQAVALRVSGDFAAFYDCFITSSQDTLYDDKGRHFYQRTYIQGNVDFIFGKGLSLFQDCDIISNARGRSGSITAQSKANETEVSGYSFYNCYIGGTGLVDLGRPWKNYAVVVFINSYLDEVVSPAGWDKWGYNPDDNTAFFSEFGNYGPGADTTKRINWLTTDLSPEEAAAYRNIDFVEGRTWLFMNV